MAANPMARLGAMDHILADLDDEAVRRMLERKAAAAPEQAKKAVGQAAEWWKRQAKPKIPVRLSINRRQLAKFKKQHPGKRPPPLYSKVGRGQLRKSLQAFVETSGDTVSGGLYNLQPYAIWLAAGTRRIARGAVMRWKPGDPLVTDWPAKHGMSRQRKPKGKGAGAAANTAMPILRPWHREALEKLAENLKKEL